MRNFAVEMGELIVKETDTSPYEPAAVAHRIVEKLQAEDPELLQGYLLSQAPSILREAINRRNASVRMMARAAASGARMKEIANAINDGEVFTLPEIKERWLNASFRLADGAQHRLKTMRRDDLTFVASEYEDRVAQNAMEATFFRTLADKIGDGVVGDVFTEEQLVALRQGLSKFK